MISVSLFDLVLLFILQTLLINSPEENSSDVLVVVSIACTECGQCVHFLSAVGI